MQGLKDVMSIVSDKEPKVFSLPLLSVHVHNNHTKFKLMRQAY